jgi:hypothetical protein
MKNLIKCGIAAAMVLATAMPAIAAQSWVVCVDQSKDVRTSTETNLVGAAILPRFFVGAAPVYPAGTVTTTATACTPAALDRTLSLPRPQTTAYGLRTAVG